jgi:choline dehydrogenase-like flavoprotein
VTAHDVDRAALFDAIIIGSGPTGGYAAKALSESGLRVLVLEAGKPQVESDARFIYDRVRRRLGYRIEEDPAAVRRQRVQSSSYAWPTHPHAFVDDIDNPYTTDPGSPFTWIRCRQVGGRVTVKRHGLQFYRLSDLDFTAGDRDGAGASWPLSSVDLAPYYQRIESWMKLRGTVRGLAHLPDSVLAQPIKPNSGQRLLAAAIESNWTDRCLIPGRTASPPVPIRDALATGRCTLRTNAVVTQLVTNVDTAMIKSVRYVGRWTRREHEVPARIVVLCASSIESTRLLLASRSRQHPEGLANSSGTLGRFLMDHVHLTGINADMPIQDGERHATTSWGYIPQFRNVGQTSLPFLRGYGVQVFTLARQCGFTVFGEMLPHPDNRVTLDPAVTDEWGVPAARIHCVYGENELAMARDAVDSCAEMMHRAGFTVWRFNTNLSPPGLASHEVGTARMGRDRNTSVLNSFCQSWDVENLFVMDGSCFPSQGVQNPTLTMLALAARSCDYLLDRLKRGEL